MVRGLELFAEYFKDYQNNYVLIGGTACYLAMDEIGVDFRATKDLDIVIIIEALSGDFVQAFWEFIKEGRYGNKIKGTEKRQFYRFSKPDDETFPFMLELFSRKPDFLENIGEGQFTPLPMEEDISSLSAILLDNDYYSFLRSGKEILQDLPVLGSSYIIPFKVKAWLDLTDRKEKGEKIDSRNIKKHKNDVLRLTQIIEPEPIGDIPKTIKNDMRIFLQRIMENPIDLKSLNIRETSIDEILNLLQDVYGIGND